MALCSARRSFCGRASASHFHQVQVEGRHFERKESNWCEMEFRKHSDSMRSACRHLWLCVRQWRQCNVRMCYEDCKSKPSAVRNCQVLSVKVHLQPLSSMSRMTSRFAAAALPYSRAALDEQEPHREGFTFGRDLCLLYHGVVMAGCKNQEFGQVKEQMCPFSAYLGCSWQQSHNGSTALVFCSLTWLVERLSVLGGSS